MQSLWITKLLPLTNKVFLSLILSIVLKWHTYLGIGYYEMLFSFLQITASSLLKKLLIKDEPLLISDPKHLLNILIFRPAFCNVKPTSYCNTPCLLQTVMAWDQPFIPSVLEFCVTRSISNKGLLSN
jgi:hypothetical protein